VQVKRCDVCQKMNRKLDIVTPELNPVPVKSPWHHIGIDFIGPIAHTVNPLVVHTCLYQFIISHCLLGNCYILTISDYFTKWVEAYATPNKTAVQVCNWCVK